MVMAGQGLAIEGCRRAKWRLIFAQRNRQPQAAGLARAPHILDGLLGIAPGPDEVEARVRAAVNLFLNGVPRR